VNLERIVEQGEREHRRQRQIDGLFPSAPHPEQQADDGRQFEITEYLCIGSVVVDPPGIGHAQRTVEVGGVVDAVDDVHRDEERVEGE
jgi:hypothetical protein